MKKLTLLFLVLVLKFAPAKAQWVTIPDANFVTFLNQNYPSCMNGNQMDTTCTGIVNETILVFPVFGNVSNLFGVQFFDAIDTLIFSTNQVTSLPNLPNSLSYLDCYGNFLSSLPVLPNTLNILNCTFNQLTSLPNLPNSLITLNCRGNQLSSLPNLPNSLTVLDCSGNQLSSLPPLPNSLTSLDCGYNNLSSLPPLSNSLTSLACNNNSLSSIPPLPNSLIGLGCSDNSLISLPALPNSLTSLFCYNNSISNLPALPNSLTDLYCYNNQLIGIPAFPNSLAYLDCSNNQLNSLPSVPNFMFTFKIANNNIFCLVNLPPIDINDPNMEADISNNSLSCVPNQTNYSMGLPLCVENGDPVNNPNNCPGLNIVGTVYKDLNSNCTLNISDLRVQNVPVKLYDNLNNFLAQSYTANGIYSFANLLPNTFQVKIDTANLPITMACGQNITQSVILTSANQTIQNINFPVVCNAAYDAVVGSIIRNGWVFPGQIHTLKTDITNNSNWYNLNCFSTNVSGTVSMQINGPFSFVAPAAGALIPTVSGNTFTYNITDFNTLNPNSFGLRLLTDTTAQSNDQICVHVEISPNPIDADTTNNVYDFCYNVFNSYDPNMKEVYPTNVLPGYDDWFTYTIHFQNTGNAPAFNIRLRDTLDTQLDLNTFEVLGYSHPATVTVSGNILTVRFNNIMLPDSTSDYEGSMGYFQYRIKPTPNLPNGSQISNTAYIYFDFNAPIITNTTENNFDITVSATNLKSNPETFEIYPNPSTGIFTFKDAKNIQRVEVYNVMGQEIAVFAGDNTNKVSKQINLSNYSKGIYFAKINGSVVLKLVKE
jgi:uncharacterized repeat protein (TIGR01451 family)